MSNGNRYNSSLVMRMIFYYIRIMQLIKYSVSFPSVHCCHCCHSEKVVCWLCTNALQPTTTTGGLPDNHGDNMLGIKFENQAEFLPEGCEGHLVVLFAHYPTLFLCSKISYIQKTRRRASRSTKCAQKCCIAALMKNQIKYK